MPIPRVKIEVSFISVGAGRTIRQRDFESIEAFVEYWNDSRDKHGQHSLLVDDDEPTIEFEGPE